MEQEGAEELGSRRAPQEGGVGVAHGVGVEKIANETRFTGTFGSMNEDGGGRGGHGDDGDVAMMVWVGLGGGPQGEEGYEGVDLGLAAWPPGEDLVAGAAEGGGWGGGRATWVEGREEE